MRRQLRVKHVVPAQQAVTADRRHLSNRTHWDNDQIAQPMPNVIETVLTEATTY